MLKTILFKIVINLEGNLVHRRIFHVRVICWFGIKLFHLFAVIDSIGIETDIANTLLDIGGLDLKTQSDVDEHINEE